MSLQTRVTLAFLIPVVLCLGIFGAVTYGHVRESALQASAQQLEAIADLKESQVDGLIQAYRHSTALVHSRVAEQMEAAEASGLPLDLSRTLLLAGTVDDEIAAVHLFSPDARVLGSTVAEVTGQVVGDAFGPYDSVSAIEAGVRIRPFVLDEGGLPRTVVIRPVVWGGRYRGVLAVRFGVASLTVAIETGAFGRTGELLLAMRDQDGNARFLTNVRQDPDAAGQILATGDRDDVPMIRALAGREGTWTEEMTDYAGNAVIAVTRYLEELDWGLVAGVDLDEALAPAASLRRDWLVLAVTLAVLVTLMGHYLGRRLAQSNERLEVELAARARAEDELGAVVATSPVAMLSVDATAGPDSGRILGANEEGERLLGRSGVELAELRFGDLVADDHVADLDRLARELAREPGISGRGRVDLVVVDDLGRRIDVEVAVIRLSTAEGDAFLITMVDLTARKRAERALEERAAELARSNRDLDEFAHVASHDLRAPLRAVDQLASFIEEDAGDVLPEDSVEDLRLLRARVARLDGLLSGLLEYSRVGRGNEPVDRVDAARVVHDVADLYLPSEGFVLEVGDDLPEIRAPQVAVELIFRNLIMNSVKHHDRDHGRIRVTGEIVGRDVVYRVADDGPGIPAGSERKIFDLFQTLRPRDEVEGSGLGLAVVKKCVERYGGTVRAMSTGGRGAVFEIRWPRFGSLYEQTRGAA